MGCSWHFLVNLPSVHATHSLGHHSHGNHRCGAFLCCTTHKKHMAGHHRPQFRQSDLLCLSKISKCLSAWELVFLHNSRRCSFFSRYSSHLWPRSSGRVLPSGSRTSLCAIKSACSTGLQESAPKLTAGDRLL